MIKAGETPRQISRITGINENRIQPRYKAITGGMRAVTEKKERLVEQMLQTGMSPKDSYNHLET